MKYRAEFARLCERGAGCEELFGAGKLFSYRSRQVVLCGCLHSVPTRPYKFTARFYR